MFLQAHRETMSAFLQLLVQHAQQHYDQDPFRFRRAAFHSQLKSKVVNLIAKAAAMCINLNIDGAPMMGPMLTCDSL